MKEEFKIGDLVEVKILRDHPEIGIVVGIEDPERTNNGLYVLIEGWTPSGGMVKAWLPLNRVKKIKTDKI
ncbi:MAG: hypothetical protein GOVbin1807_202 [Prokaryotic dsDNA virus sp.]|nr:MAG: hypothetical protein GOVbin1807_202 [Prokaryotic dsDNA virus sp.]|tara:strand:+ start:1536 stop:1745 length:210 start_codon:yes stop_codon:yes gene_type:complete